MLDIAHSGLLGKRLFICKTQFFAQLTNQFSIFVKLFLYDPAPLLYCATNLPLSKPHQGGCIPQMALN